MAAGAQLRFWIDMALECIRRDHTDSLDSGTLGPGDQRGPFLSARALGMALAAMHDAHALAGDGRALLGVPASEGLAGGNPILAGAAACQQLLMRRYPKQDQALRAAWLAWQELHGVPAGAAVEAAARAIADAIHARGARDQFFADPNRYEPRNEPYRHIAPPDQPDQGYAGAIWGDADILLVPRPAFPRPPGRSSATSVAATAHYRADFAKVMVKGVDRSPPTAGPQNTNLLGARTREEEMIGIFWGYDGAQELGTPPRLYAQVALGILDTIEATEPGRLGLPAELAVMAGIGIAMADAGIHAWHYKYSPLHMMWRPAVGIPGAIGGNGAPVPGWKPLGRPDTNGRGLALTPNFPAYPSGHASFGAAAFQLLRLFLVEKQLAGFDARGRDDIGFAFQSDEFNGRNADPRSALPREPIRRLHRSLWQAMVDNAVSRVFLGAHWQFDGLTVKGADPDGEFGVPETPDDLGKRGGVWLGAQIGNAVARRLGVTEATIAASRIAG